MNMTTYRGITLTVGVLLIMFFTYTIIHIIRQAIYTKRNINKSFKICGKSAKVIKTCEYDNSRHIYYDLAKTNSGVVFEVNYRKKKYDNSNVMSTPT